MDIVEKEMGEAMDMEGVNGEDDKLPAFQTRRVSDLEVAVRLH